MPIAITKHIPLPTGVKLMGRRGRPERYPFRYMQLGDSFLAPSTASESRVRSAAASAGKRLGDGFRFHVHKYTKHEGSLAGRIRVWRIA